MQTFEKLFGASLTDSTGATHKTAEKLAGLGGVMIYFSAHWCPPCRSFTPKLVDTYAKMKAAGKKFETVFVSDDKTQAAFDGYVGEMPWLALPYKTERKLKDALAKRFNVQSLPSLVVLDGNGKFVTNAGTRKVTADPAGKAFPWLKSLGNVKAGTGEFFEGGFEGGKPCPESAESEECNATCVAEVCAAAKGKRLPVTLLSGFLGSGKTTLLTHILRNKAGLRCAVLVNDMGEINVDANLVRDGGLIQVEEDMVQLENGCICCTLRADLVVEIAKMVRQNKFDYLVIESTGISEPQQVAETFTMEVPVEEVLQHASGGGAKGVDAVPSESPGEEAEESHSLQALSTLARLDTCVTVIDAANFDLQMASVVTVQEGEYSRARRAEGDNAAAEDEKKPFVVPEEDDRTLVDLMVDQIEFADVIIINKLDIALPEQTTRVKAVVKRLNPNAKVLTSTKSVVPLAEIIGTGRFNMDVASEMASWQRDVADIEAGVAPVPETEEYGVGSFVFSACRPFHPARLHAFIEAHFFMCVEFDEDTEEAEPEPGDGSAIADDGGDRKGGGAEDGEEESDGEEDGDDEITELISVDDRREKQKVMRQRSEDSFGGVLLRSKGIVWLASSRYFSCGWGQAGAFITLSCLDKAWSSEVAADDEGPLTKAPQFRKTAATTTAGAGAASNRVTRASAKSSAPPYGRAEDGYAMHGLDSDFVLGDKRTELVLIGHGVNKGKLRKCLEACLVTDVEIARVGAPGAKQDGWCGLEDPFEIPVIWSAEGNAPGGDDADDAMGTPAAEVEAEAGTKEVPSAKRQKTEA